MGGSQLPLDLGMKTSTYPFISGNSETKSWHRRRFSSLPMGDLQGWTGQHELCFDFSRTAIPLSLFNSILVHRYTPVDRSYWFLPAFVVCWQWQHTCKQSHESPSAVCSILRQRTKQIFTCSNLCFPFSPIDLIGKVIGACTLVAPNAPALSLSLFQLNTLMKLLWVKNNWWRFEIGRFEGWFFSSCPDQLMVLLPEFGSAAFTLTPSPAPASYLHLNKQLQWCLPVCWTLLYSSPHWHAALQRVIWVPVNPVNALCCQPN